jgi:hypothetical protein
MRTPPSAFPFASRRMGSGALGSASRISGECGGTTPSATQRRSARSPAARELRGRLDHPERHLGVRSARDLPPSVRCARGLSGTMRPERDHVSFGLEIEHGDTHVRADPRTRRDGLGLVRGERLGPETCGGRTAAVHQVPVEELLAPMERVQVRDQAERGLRAPCSEHVPWAKRPERPTLAGGRSAERPRRLREDVVGEPVARVLEPLVADRIPGLEPRARRVDADGLRTDSHPRVPFAQQLFFHLRVVRSAFRARRDVQPLHDERAVERGCLARAPHEHAHRVRRGLVRPRLPAPVGSPGALPRVAGRTPGKEPLFLDPPVGERAGGAERPASGAARDRPLERGGRSALGRGLGRGRAEQGRDDRGGDQTTECGNAEHRMVHRLIPPGPESVSSYPARARRSGRHRSAPQARAWRKSPPGAARRQGSSARDADRGATGYGFSQ